MAGSDLRKTLTATCKGRELLNNVCVIGGSGFIGSRLCQRLAAAEVDFSIVDKAPSATFPLAVRLADVRDPAALRNAVPPASAYMLLAAEHRDDVRPLSLYQEVNVDGARRVCELARERGVKRIIFTSSVAIYGFAPIGTDESGSPNPFNEYGRTKWEAEQVLRAWQAESPEDRTLVVVRPTVVFGERNRGNVYNLLRQIASGRFVMIGSGENRKSMAYVENVAAFLQHGLSMGPGIHTYNFIDKPDFTMNTLVAKVNGFFGRAPSGRLRLPFSVGYAIGLSFDFVARLTGRRFPISAIRVRKFCADSVYNTAIARSGFTSPVSLEDGLLRTVQFEFINKVDQGPVFYSE